MLSNTDFNEEEEEEINRFISSELESTLSFLLSPKNSSQQASSSTIDATIKVNPESIKVVDAEFKAFVQGVETDCAEKCVVVANDIKIEHLDDVDVGFLDYKGEGIVVDNDYSKKIDTTAENIKFNFLLNDHDLKTATRESFDIEDSKSDTSSTFSQPPTINDDPTNNKNNAIDETNLTSDDSQPLNVVWDSINNIGLNPKMTFLMNGVFVLLFLVLVLLYVLSGFNGHVLVLVFSCLGLAGSTNWFLVELEKEKWRQTGSIKIDGHFK